MSFATILLVIFIGLLAFKGLFGDLMRTSVMTPQYPVSGNNPISTGFAVIAGLLILVATLWLLTQTGGLFPEPAADKQHTALYELQTTRTDTPRVNKRPGQRKKTLQTASLETTAPPTVEENDNGPAKVPEKTPFYLVAVKRHADPQAGINLQRIFSLRHFEVIELARGQYITGIFCADPAEASELIRDLKRHPADLNRYGLTPRLIDLGTTFGIPVKAPGDAYWRCAPTR